MTETQEDALQAAMLAKFVGSNLNQIDSLTTDRRSVPANRLNIDDFISKVTNKNVNQNQNQNQYFQPNQGHFASPPPEELIRQMVPDPQPRSFENLNDQSKGAPVNSISSQNIETLLEKINNNLELLISVIKNG
jgi:hypothetical protein